MADEPQVLISSKDDQLANLLLGEGFGEGVRYDHSRSRWIIWNGVRWQVDRRRQVYDRMRQKADGYWASIADDRSKNDERKAILPIYDTGKKEGILKSLSAREGIAMNGNEWDLEPSLLGFDNGVMDLSTGKFDPHPSPNLLISKSVNYDWVPDAECPQFESFIQEIMGGNPDLYTYLLTLLGYALFGFQREQKFWMWVGRGANGKGVLARTLLKVLGEYAEEPADTLYMKQRFGSAPSSAARPDLVRLQGVRFAPMSEPQGGRFNEEMLKAHTGDDPILARDLYKGSEQMLRFSPTHTIVVLTNDPPKTEDVGVSMRRRARVIRFEQDYSPDSGRSDQGIEDRLKAEAPGIIRLLTVMAVRWWKSGLVEPVQVTDWSKEYIEDNDPLAAFIKDSCVVGPKERGQAAALFGAYQEWCAKHDEDPKSQTGFGLALGLRFAKVKTKSVAVYHGIRPKSALEDSEDG